MLAKLRPWTVSVAIAVSVVACGETERQFGSPDGLGGAGGGQAGAGGGGAGTGAGGGDAGAAGSSPGGAGSSAGGGETGGAGGEAGGAGAPPVDCEPGTLDCNGDPADGCEAAATDAPPAVSPVSPVRGAYTGSLHAPAARNTLRPTLTWSPSATSCGALSYEVQLDDSCTPGELHACAFASPEVSARTDRSELTPEKSLPVSETSPVGALYAWRVRACDGARQCSAWSDVAYLHVGRPRDDINGDGYTDALLRNGDGDANQYFIDVYLGGQNFNSGADARILQTASAGGWFIGDIDADGYADAAILQSNYATCASSGQYMTLLYGGPDVEDLRAEPQCKTAGSPSVVLRSGFVGDFNGDGFAEVSLARGFGNTDNRLMLFAGAPSFDATPFVDIDANIEGANYVLTLGNTSFDGGGDFDGDGFPDIVVTGSGHSAGFTRVWYLPGGRSAPEDFSDHFDVTSCSSAQAVRMVGDLNGDGLSDWAFACRQTSSVFGMIYGGAFASAPSDEFEVDATLTAISAAMDFDNDGVLEFFILQNDAAPLIWRYGQFDPESPPVFSRMPSGDQVAVGDHDGDGRSDLLVGSTTNAAWGGSFSSFNITAVNLLVPADVTYRYGLVF